MMGMFTTGNCRLLSEMELAFCPDMMYSAKIVPPLPNVFSARPTSMSLVLSTNTK